jgi:hypothetical protein
VTSASLPSHPAAVEALKDARVNEGGFWTTAGILRAPPLFALLTHGNDLSPHPPAADGVPFVFTGVAQKPSSDAAGGALTATVRLPMDALASLVKLLAD